jgi:hypothetical protein
LESYQREWQKKGEENVSEDMLGGIKWKDEEALKAQRVIIWNFAKKMGKNLFSGHDLTKIPLPIQLFEPESFLQRLAKQYMFAHKYLTAASQATDPVERLQHVMVWWVAGMNLMGEQFRKPFNPILGETYQCIYEDGSMGFFEQSSHHPPISCWEVSGQEGAYTYAGWGELTAQFRGNSVKALQTGTQNVYFPDGGHITFTLPTVWVTGMAWGDRVIKYCGEMNFSDASNELSCTLTLNPKDKKGLFFSKHVSTPDFMRGEILKKDGKKQKKVSVCEGSWLSELAFDGKVLWTLAENDGVKAPVPASDPLPSDSQFREDLQFTGQGDLTRGGEWKVLLEEKQRYDVKLRKNAKEAHKRMKDRAMAKSTLA